MAAVIAVDAVTIVVLKVQKIRQKKMSNSEGENIRSGGSFGYFAV